MPPNMMKALIGSSENVAGRSTATVSAGPMPGSTPTAVPSVTPSSAQNRCESVSALAKPLPRACNVPVTVSQPAFEYAGGQTQVEKPCKQQVCSNGRRHTGNRIAHGMVVVEGARGQPEQRR